MNGTIEWSCCLVLSRLLDNRPSWYSDGGRGDAERGDEDVDNGDEEDAEDSEVVDLVRLAQAAFLLRVVHVVVTVDDKADSNRDLKHIT